MSVESNSVKTLLNKVLQMRLQTEVLCVYMHAKRSHMHVKDHAVHVRVWWTMETLKITNIH